MPPLHVNIIPATIKALTTFVQVLDKHPRGSFMLVLIIVAFGGLIAISNLPVLLSSAMVIV